MWVILGHLVILWQVVFKLKMVKMKQCEITIQSNRCEKWPTWSKFITMSDWLCHKKYIIHNIKYQGFTFLSGCARAISHFWLVAHVPLNNFPRIILIKCGSHLKYRTGGWYVKPMLPLLVSYFQQTRISQRVRQWQSHFSVQTYSLFLFLTSVINEQQCS